MPDQPTHLISHGHMVCGAIRGHMGPWWPSETRITVSLDRVTCPECLKAIGRPPSATPVVDPLDPLVNKVVEDFGQTEPFQQVARLLERGATIEEIGKVARLLAPGRRPS